MARTAAERVLEPAEAREVRAQRDLPLVGAPPDVPADDVEPEGEAP